MRLLIRTAWYLLLVTAAGSLADLFVGVCSGRSLVPTTSTPGIMAKSAIVIVALVTITIAARAQVEHHQLGASHEGPLAAMPTEDLLEELKALGRLVARVEYATLLQLLTDLPRESVRVSETLTVEANAIRRSVTREIVVPASISTAGTAGQILPVARVTKGHLLPDFDLEINSKPHTPTLGYHETQALNLMLLALAFSQAYKSRVPPGIESIFAAIADHVLQPTAPPKTDVEINLGILKGLADDPHSAALRQLCALYQFLANDYVLFARSAVSELGRYLVRYSMTLDYRVDGRSLADKLRLVIGLRPITLTYPLNLAFDAKSYHLRVRAPRRQYVFRVEVRPKNSRGRASKGISRWMAKIPGASMQVGGGRGLDHAHVYIRGLHKKKPRDYVVVVRLHEVPPGLLGTAAAANAFLTFLLLCLSITSLRYPLASGDFNLEALSLVLSAPGLAAVFSVTKVDEDALFRTSLTAAFGLVACIVASFAATILVAAQRLPKVVLVHSGSRLTHRHVLDFTSSTRDVVWLALLAVVVTYSTYLIYVWAVRSLIYAQGRSVVSQKDGGS